MRLINKIASGTIILSMLRLPVDDLDDQLVITGVTYIVTTTDVADKVKQATCDNDAIKVRQWIFLKNEFEKVYYIETKNLF